MQNYTQYIPLLVNLITVIVFLVKITFSLNRLNEIVKDVVASIKVTAETLKKQDREIFGLLQKNESIDALAKNSTIQFEQINKTLKDLELSVERIKWVQEQRDKS